MVAKKVAVEGDTTATVGTMPFTGADTGTWTAGTIEESAYPKLRCAGTPVIWEATCKFSFIGTGPPPVKPTIKGDETVTVTATTNLINKTQHSVLVGGASSVGKYGNKLQISATGPLTTD
ncbi:MAG: hypothetical protein WA988_03185 [Candidatus Nanopelagicales bacterium]